MLINGADSVAGAQTKMTNFTSPMTSRPKAAEGNAEVFKKIQMPDLLTKAWDTSFTSKPGINCQA